MLIAWQAINAARSAELEDLLARLPRHHPRHHHPRPPARAAAERPDSYYRDRGLVPTDMLADLGRAQGRHHQLPRLQAARDDPARQRHPRGAAGPRPRDRDDSRPRARCSQRVMRRPDGAEERRRHQRRGASLLPRAARAPRRRSSTGEERKEAEENTEAARLWISGIEAVKRHLGLGAVYDLSATPFFLSRLRLARRARSSPGWSATSP